ncbi:alpha/beta hydrolase [Nocardiopsis nanhaiensis]
MTQGRRTQRRGWLRYLLWAVAGVLVVLVIAAVAFVAWGLNAYRAEPDPLARAAADPAVNVERGDDAVVITPAEEASGTGVVFYPGARVEADAYVASWAPVVGATGVTVVLPDLRLNLAVLDVDRADSAVEEAPEVSEWYLGGHSMGGAMSALHLGDDDAEDRWKGLILWASYATEDAGLADRDDLRVLSVSGDLDPLVAPDDVEVWRVNLPTDAAVVAVEGMNHSQFGAYGEQPSDNEPELTDEQAHEALAEATSAFLAPD